MTELKLGCGLIGIGRTWGVVETPIPSEAEVTEFLNAALALGITFFDTAPAYGTSEARFGAWLATLPLEQRSSLTVATKCGEHWDVAENKPYKDFSFEALQCSIDQSLRLLGAIDILQIHGVTPAVLADFSQQLHQAFEYAQSLGIGKMGMSLSDPAAFGEALSFPEVSVLQIQHNILNPYPTELIEKAVQRDITLITNRPFGMGKLGTASEAEKINALRFIQQTVPTGVVLTGTKSPEHLQENVRLFEEAEAAT